MNRIDKVIQKIYSFASIRSVKGWILTPVVGSLFALFTIMFIVIPVNIELYLKLPVLLSPPVNYYFSIPFFVFGFVLMIWTNLQYTFNKGTAVPLTPPKKLISNGLFRYSRNPMHTGVFLLMYGFAFYQSSILAAVVFIPVYISFDIRMIKLIEEPELERRLGEEYIEYKKRTPMFFPKFFNK